jgi:hypothetical protein
LKELGKAEVAVCEKHCFVLPVLVLRVDHPKNELEVVLADFVGVKSNLELGQNAFLATPFIIAFRLTLNPIYSFLAFSLFDNRIVLPPPHGTLALVLNVQASKEKI